MQDKLSVFDTAKGSVGPNELLLTSGRRAKPSTSVPAAETHTSNQRPFCATSIRNASLTLSVGTFGRAAQCNEWALGARMSTPKHPS